MRISPRPWQTRWAWMARDRETRASAATAWPPGRRLFPLRATSNQRAREPFWLQFRERLRSPSGRRKSRRSPASAQLTRGRGGAARDCYREQEPERGPPRLLRAWLPCGRSEDALAPADFFRKFLVPSCSNSCPAKPGERRTTRQGENPESRRRIRSTPGKKRESPRAF